MIRALLVVAMLVGCGGSAATPTPDLPRESRVLTQAEQEAWLARDAEGKALCGSLRPIQMPSGLTCWDGITLPAD